jgi:hypothetical protein
MALAAFFLRLIKDKRCMALPAVNSNMLADKRQPGLIVVEGINVSIQLPAFRTMTSFTTDLEISAVR